MVKVFFVIDDPTISERALQWATRLFKYLEIELEQDGDKVLWSMKQVGEEPNEFKISCSFEKESMIVFVGTDFLSQLKGRIGGNILSGPELSRFLELYMGPLVSYLESAKASWICSRDIEDLDFGLLESLGTKKFKVGDMKIKANGFRFTPSGRTRLAMPVVNAEFWVASVGGEEVLILSDVRLAGPIRKSYVRVRKMIPRER